MIGALCIFQINQVTAFLDGSAVYSSTAEHAKELREFRGGRLTMQRSLQGHSLLPVNAEECSDFLRQRFCFKAGIRLFRVVWALTSF